MRFYGQTHTQPHDAHSHTKATPLTPDISHQDNNYPHQPKMNLVGKVTYLATPFDRTLPLSRQKEAQKGHPVHTLLRRVEWSIGNIDGSKRRLMLRLRLPDTLPNMCHRRLTSSGHRGASVHSLPRWVEWPIGNIDGSKRRLLALPYIQEGRSVKVANNIIIQWDFMCQLCALYPSVTHHFQVCPGSESRLCTLAGACLNVLVWDILKY